MYNQHKMKKLLILCLVLALYLNRSYSYFYDFLGQQHLSPPVHNTKTTLGQTNNQVIKYLALGDSLTAGVGALDYKNTYPYQVAQKLSVKNKVELINVAHAGDTSNDVLINQLPQALSAKPDLITLMIGINDIHNLKSLGEFKSNLLKITSSLKKTGARIYLISIPYLGSSKIVYFPYNFILDFRTKQFNQTIQQIATNEGFKYIDLYSLTEDTKFYSADQFHPSVGVSGMVKDNEC